MYLLIKKNLNPFSLDRILTDNNKHEMFFIYALERMHVTEILSAYLQGKKFLLP